MGGSPMQGTQVRNDVPFLRAIEGLEVIRNKGVGYLFIKSRAIRDS